MRKPHPLVTPTAQVFLWGIVAYLLICLVFLLPPLQAPVREPFYLWFASVGSCGFSGLVVYYLFTGLAKKQWGVLLSLAILVVLWFPVRLVGHFADQLWVRHFTQTAELRERFKQFMDAQNPPEGKVVILPTEFRVLTDGSVAYHTRDGEGKRTYCYSSLTHGIDNSTGFCWSESGKPPMELAFPQITWTKALGGGWYMFRST